ncbi:DUF2066 domain-containing protein [Stutzerimonas balearica]|uniref:DUF2066 domain-containing protein n=1 Tax=Stutzerimonas balearica TaxID=74829 RepID=UPI0022AEAD93|nr:DUF2066 domain-containing protein [Stutzerimonas balearica]MCZ4129018.1 DUF2066 domain-containing protein [Stutzerimonas balearica]
MRLVSRVLASCLVLVALSASAEPVQQLYQVREPVASQQPAERSQALQRAFDTLLLRLTGSTEALEKPAVAALRNDPQQLVSKYGYENDRLVVEFDPATTERQLREAGVSLWGFDRPLVLTWWLDETPEGSQLVAGGQGAVQELQDAAQHRGLPLMLPIADLGEQLMATPEAFAGKALEAVREPSERYDADVVLAVHAKQTDTGWQADWALAQDGASSSGEAKGDSRAAVADAVMLAVARYLAPHYVVAAGAAEELTLEVLGADVSRFAELERLLQPFSARLVEVADDRLIYRLRASPEQLRAQMALARLSELPADELPSEPAVSPDAVGDGAAEGSQTGEPAPAAAGPAPGTVLRFR